MFGGACGEDKGVSAAPLWAHKVGDALSRYCNVMRRVGERSYVQWIPMNFLKDEALRNLELIGKLVQWTAKTSVPTR